MRCPRRLDITSKSSSSVVDGVTQREYGEQRDVGTDVPDGLPKGCHEARRVDGGAENERHLLTAIGHHAGRLHPNIVILYDTLEHFMEHAMSAIERGQRPCVELESRA